MEALSDVGYLAVNIVTKYAIYVGVPRNISNYAGRFFLLGEEKLVHILFRCLVPL